MKQQLVAWKPQIAASSDLISVMVPLGELTESQWLKALAQRVNDLVMLEPNPVRATQRACRAMGLWIEDNPSQAGRVMVLHNTELQTHLNCQGLEDDPWPAQVTGPDEEAETAIQDTDFQSWVEQALSAVSAHSLD